MEIDFNILIDEINKNLNIYLEENAEYNIIEPMKYSVNAGGKRFRPMLMLLTTKAFGKDYKKAMPFAMAIEFIHTYSLIHDDLPSMDNDDLRRGFPTCHIKFDEATAILTGDSLLNIAFEIMLQAIKNNFEQKYIDVMLEIAKASGSRGMIGGQVADMKAERKKISKDELLYIHENKTGKLITASILSGAIISGATKEQIQTLKDISYKLGIAFQIKDDILDIEGNENFLGKPILSDIKNNKTTYVSINGLEKSKLDYEKLSYEVLDGLEKLHFKDKMIYKYIKALVNREK